MRADGVNGGVVEAASSRLPHDVHGNGVPTLELEQRGVGLPGFAADFEELIRRCLGAVEVTDGDVLDHAVLEQSL
eukprot:CAMPEP_0184244508 /NCGR_PEP_ID=MMETSP0977-20130417/918_1 /TAXON_ID=483370 /ORGANISM="non described non described, Strain CCMP2097" /LENGTH=74 /DNA_ID=CAMNT_0026549797 /DNA_START=65 /DNA_END=286 /DNA_ORIENTATION=+